MIVLYSRYLFFPGGNPAADFQVQILHHASNQSALLFTDGTGTVPAPNPLTTEEDGLASFYAPPGDYSAILGGEPFHIPVDASVATPVWPGLWVHTQTSPSSVWTINHHFGVMPRVDVLLAERVAIVDVEHPDVQTTTITFGAPTVGTAHLRR